MKRLCCFLTAFLLLTVTNITSAKDIYLFSEIHGSVQYDGYLVTESYHFNEKNGTETVSLVWLTLDRRMKNKPYFHNYWFQQQEGGMHFRVYYENEHRESGGWVRSSKKNITIYDTMRIHCGNPYYGRDYL